MKQIIYITLSVLLLSACVTQPPAPIEYGSSSSKSSSYSETTRSNLNDSGSITRRELVSNQSFKTSGDLKEKEEITIEHKEFSINEDTRLEEKSVAAENQKHEIATTFKQKKSKSLEEEMDEIAAQPHEDEVKAAKHDVINEEIVRPEKVKIDKADIGVLEEKFAMPVSGKIVTRFGEDKGGKKSNGIDISAARGASVKSVAAGKVVYAGQDPKFGNLIIVKIGSTEMFAAYAHMDDLLLRRDDDVDVGQIIGHVGSTGDVTTPELHFAIRKGKTPVDPLRYLSGVK